MAYELMECHILSKFFISPVKISQNRDSANYCFTIKAHYKLQNTVCCRVLGSHVKYKLVIQCTFKVAAYII